MADFDWTRLRILIVDGDLDFLSWGDSTLREAGVAEVRCTMVGSDAVNILRQFSADAVVLEPRFGGGRRPRYPSSLSDLSRESK